MHDFLYKFLKDLEDTGRVTDYDLRYDDVTKTFFINVDYTPDTPVAFIKLDLNICVNNPEIEDEQPESTEE